MATGRWPAHRYQARTEHVQISGADSHIVKVFILFSSSFLLLYIYINFVFVLKSHENFHFIKQNGQLGF